ncbi:hypothetical protein F4604DRAFT_1945958 [Suillus subluteus]|nr:hypothetical protein F4604DRAFT_1945958 [Suillus subluteus]
MDKGMEVMDKGMEVRMCIRKASGKRGNIIGRSSGIRDMTPIKREKRKKKRQNRYSLLRPSLPRHHQLLITNLPPPETSPSRNSTSNNDGSFNVYFLRPMPLNDGSMHPNMTSVFLSSAFLVAPPNSKTSLFPDEEYMPLLMPSRPFEYNPAPAYSKLGDARVKHRKEDVSMFNLSSPPPVSKQGSIPYHSLARTDGRIIITFEKLTRPEAEEYLTTESAKYNDYHSVYIPNVMHAIESFCFCQDKFIANDWDTHMFRDSSYSGHPVIPGGIKLPTGGPCSGQTWKERLQELRDHRAHTQHLIHLIQTVLSTRMLAEATNRTKIIKCDELLHIQGGYTNKIYSGHYDDVNPFFSESEAKRLNSYTAIAEAHREPELASKFLDALLMPCPNEDTIYALMDSRLLNVGNT